MFDQGQPGCIIAQSDTRASKRIEIYGIEEGERRSEFLGVGWRNQAVAPTVQNYGTYSYL